MTLDPRSEEKLLGVRPELVKVIREAATRTKFRVTEGLRDRQRQAQLVAARKSKTMNSRHITGHAIDFIAIGEDGVATYDDDDMQRVADVIAEVAKEQGTKIERGIDWGWDSPHIELDRKTYPAKAVGVTTKIIEAARDAPKTTATVAVATVEVAQQTAEPVAQAAEKVSGFAFPDLTQLQLVRDFAMTGSDLLSWFSNNIILAVICGGVAAAFTFLPKLVEKLPPWLRSSPSS
jgi:peptidoglycan LD-endopeptidase CwlK